MLKGVTAWLLILLFSGCARTFAEFRPHSSNSFRRVVHSAQFAYEGDIPALAQAGAEIVGNVRVDGNGFADSDDIRSRALEDAAAAGGTHVIIAGENASTSWAKITPDKTTTTTYGNTATTTYTPGAQIPVTRLSGSFLVIAVPPERWQDLPVALQPPETKTLPHRPIEQPRTSAPNESSGWYCTADMNDNGLCFRGNDDCRQSHQELISHGFAPCRPYSSAWCYSSSRAGQQPYLACLSSMSSCREQRDYSMSQGALILVECTNSE